MGTFPVFPDRVVGDQHALVALPPLLAVGVGVMVAAQGIGMFLRLDHTQLGPVRCGHQEARLVAQAEAAAALVDGQQVVAHALVRGQGLLPERLEGVDEGVVQLLVGGRVRARLDAVEDGVFELHAVLQLAVGCIDHPLPGRIFRQGILGRGDQSAGRFDVTPLGECLGHRAVILGGLGLVLSLLGGGGGAGIADVRVGRAELAGV